MCRNSAIALSKLCSSSSSVSPLPAPRSLTSMCLAMSSAGLFCRWFTNDSNDSLTTALNASSPPNDSSATSSARRFSSSSFVTMSLSLSSSLTIETPL